MVQMGPEAGAAAAAERERWRQRGRRDARKERTDHAKWLHNQKNTHMNVFIRQKHMLVLTFIHVFWVVFTV